MYVLNTKFSKVYSCYVDVVSSLVPNKSYQSRKCFVAVIRIQRSFLKCFGFEETRWIWIQQTTVINKLPTVQITTANTKRKSKINKARFYKNKYISHLTHVQWKEILLVTCTEIETPTVWNNNTTKNLCENCKLYL